jgi:hypothetical protein
LIAQWIRGIDADTLNQVQLQQSADELMHVEILPIENTIS